MKFFVSICAALLLISTSIAATETAKPAYVQRFFAKHNWKVFEACMVVGYFDGKKEIEVKRRKEKDAVVSDVPASATVLVVEAMTSTDSIFRSLGGLRFRMAAKLKPGVRYNMNLIRNDKHVEVWISEEAAGIVSEKLSFDIEHPVIKPIIIPIPI